MYRNALQIHVPRTGTDVDVILAAVEEYLMMLAKERIRIAFDHAQKDVGDLRQRTKEGIETARLNGKIIGHPKGQHSVSEREVRAKRQMMKRVRSVGDDLNASDCMKIIGISRKIYYKYKKRCYNNKIKMWIQIKAGPQTINKDDVATIVGHFQAAIRLSRTNNLHISSDNCVVGVFYGEPKDLSANYRKTDKDFPVYIGRDFWHRLTGDEDFYDILTQNNPIGNLIMR